MSAHSKIGASSAYRWFECPGSVRLIEKAPKQESGDAAKKGTAAHWVLEECLGKGIDPWDYCQQVAPNGYCLEDEDIEAVIVAIDEIAKLRADGKYMLHKEIGFHIDTIHPDLWGTADVVLISSDMKKLKVIDYKHGEGFVSQVNNKQLLYYTLGAIQYADKEFGDDVLDMVGWGGVFDEVTIVVIQPRCGGEAMRPWDVTRERLEEFAVELEAAAKATEDPKAAIVPGEKQCHWCPAVGICPGPFQLAQEVAKTDFLPVGAATKTVMPSAETLSTDQVGMVLTHQKLFEEFFAEVKNYARYLMESGEEVPGMKLVKKKADRQWTDPEETESTLGVMLSDDELFKKKLISPAQAEKLLDKKLVADLAFKPDNGNTIAPEHDRRKAVAPSAINDFERIEE